MATTLRSRPWRLASSLTTTTSSTSTTLLRASALSSPSPSPISSSSSYSPTLPTRRHKSNKSNFTRAHGAQRITPERATSSASTASTTITTAQILAPGTFIPLPLQKLPWTDPTSLARYLYLRLKTRFVDRLTTLMLTFNSRPTLFGKARMRLDRKSIVPTAKALHAAMSEAMARGDTEALRKVCWPKMYQALATAVEARGPRSPVDGLPVRRYTWELVAYQGTPFWPRIVDSKFVDLGVQGGVHMAFRQAVVGIKSRQRLAQYEMVASTGLERRVEGGEREKDVMEYLVLWRQTNTKTYAQGEWKLFGTLQETTLEDYDREMKLIADMSA